MAVFVIIITTILNEKAYIIVNCTTGGLTLKKYSIWVAILRKIILPFMDHCSIFSKPNPFRRRDTTQRECSVLHISRYILVLVVVHTHYVYDLRTNTSNLLLLSWLQHQCKTKILFANTNYYFYCDYNFLSVPLQNTWHKRLHAFDSLFNKLPICFMNLPVNLTYCG